MIKIYLPIFFSFLALSNFSNAQTGPGGVGTTGTSGNVGLWLRADAITGTANNATLQTWPDASGRGSNAVQLTPASRPTYIQSSPFNNRPALRFNSGSGNTNDFMEVASTPILAGSNGGAADAFTFFAVVRMRNLTNTANRGILSKRTSTVASGTAYNFYFDGGGDQELSYDIANNTTLNGEDNGEDYDNDVNYIVGFRFDGNLDNDDRGAIYDGTDVYGFYEHNFSTFNDNNAPVTIGRLAGDANTFSNMDVAEIIHFNRRLNTAEFIILQNYLSAKYGIAIGDNEYFYDATHGNDVAGIGRENSANQQTDARGTGIVRISNPSDLDNGNYLLWGHDNTPLSQVSFEIPPALVLSNGQRLAREWRVSEDGEVGNVTLTFDLTDIPSITASNFTNLRLLIDGNGNFDNATIVGSPTGNFANGNRTVSFSVAGNLLGDGNYFTLASTSSSATPLPVNFISVEASNQGGKVVLQWVTASEENNDFFTVERSKDGQSWEMVTTVQGTGNSSQPLGYQAYDQTPYNGTSYYRIKQTDLDGTTGYSKAVPVKVLPTGAGIMLFPNPVKDGKLHLTFAEDLPVRTLALTNMLGQVVYEQTIDPAAQVTVDLYAQSPGVYFVTLTGPGYRSVHKLVIE
jgi:hypothetical protein